MGQRTQAQQVITETKGLTWWAGTFEGLDYACGHCEVTVGSDVGMVAISNQRASVSWAAICPACGHATILRRSPTARRQLVQWPSVPPGEAVRHVPTDVSSLYTEARRAIGAGASTASVLALRKLLMHVAVDLGAQPGNSFASYVGYLLDEGYLPPNARGWVDRIRERSNEANHEIVLMGEEAATELLEAATLLLKIAYEFPASVPGAEPPQRSGGESHKDEDG